MDKDTLTAIIESILLTSKGPVALAAVVEAVDDKTIGEKDLLKVFEAVGETWDRPDSGLRLEKVAGGWRYW